MSSRRAEQRRRVFCDKSNAMKKDCSTTDHRTPSVSSTSLQGANDKRQPPVASARSLSVTGRGRPTFAICFWGSFALDGHVLACTLDIGFANPDTNPAL